MANETRDWIRCPDNLMGDYSKWLNKNLPTKKEAEMHGIVGVAIVHREVDSRHFFVPSHVHDITNFEEQRKLFIDQPFLAKMSAIKGKRVTDAQEAIEIFQKSSGYKAYLIQMPEGRSDVVRD